MPANIKITTAHLFDNNDALVNIEHLLNTYPDIESFTYVDSSKMYMYKNTSCQITLPNELHIPLSNMSDYNTSSNKEKATYVLTEIASWSPMIVTINGIKKHVVSHAEYEKTLGYFTNNSASTIQN